MAAADMEDSITLPFALRRLSELVDARPHAFILGDEEMYAASLEATKFVFDLSLQQEHRARAPVADLIRSIDPSAQPQTRSQSRALANKPRAPTPPPRTDDEIWRPTPLDALHLEGMDDVQVWAQLELRTTTLCDALMVVLEEEVPQGEDDETVDAEKDGLEEFENLGDMEDIDEEDYDGQRIEYDEDEDEDEDKDETEDEDEDEDEDDGEDEDLGEDIAGLRDPSDDDSDEESDVDGEAMDLDKPPQTVAKTKKKKQQIGHPDLDDAFFSLADFNAEIEEAEAKAVSKGRLEQDDDDDDDDEAEDDIDLFDVVDDAGAETFEEEDLEGEAYYKDFFAAPSRKTLSINKDRKGKAVTAEPETKRKSIQVRFHEEVKVKKIKSRGKGLPLKDAMMRKVGEDDDDDDDEFDEEWGEVQMDDSEDEDEDMEDGDDYDGGIGNLEDGIDEDEDEDRGGRRETIERLKDDLFAEDDDDKPSKDISTYEARQAEITAQIAELEAKNVGPKDWTLMGEANTRSRPINSLLEEDLEFDRVMKPVPVVTEETVSSLEDMIKRRILDNRFDDVVRQRTADDKPFLPSRLFELNDQKSIKSLAEIYENEYTAAASGTSVDDRDGKLKKEHEAIEKIWENICYKLDALSNAHFTPKAPKATITTVSNFPVASIESALPTTQSTKTMMAPEEIFAPQADIRAKEELTPLEKKAHRIKQRKARKKASDQLAATVDKFAKSQKPKGSAGSVRREKEKALKNVVKTGKGVTVVGKQKAELKGKSQQSTALPTDGKKFKL